MGHGASVVGALDEDKGGSGSSPDTKSPEAAASTAAPGPPPVPATAAASQKSPIFPPQPVSIPMRGLTEGAAASPASPGGGLAARRRMMADLKVSTNREGPITAGQSSGAVDTRKTIKVVKTFSDFYRIGQEVMPSTNAGMEVRFAKRNSDAHEVVIKTRVKAKSFTSKDDEQEWRRSTEMLLNLPESQNICQLYEVMEDDKLYYAVMEKVDGTDLFERIHGGGRIALGEAKAILRQLLQAVRDLHARGCIHKDLKLENVMVDSPKYRSPGSPKGKPSAGQFSPPQSPTVVKLIDFDTVETFSPKTLAKSVVGTDQYIAPEAYGGRYSPPTDIFSVGVIAYKLISGRFPFKEGMFDDQPGENWVGSPKMKVIQDRLNKFKVNFEIAPWPTEAKARDLTRWMLENDGKDRPTAQQALEHGFFEVTGQTPALPKGPWGRPSLTHK